MAGTEASSSNILVGVCGGIAAYKCAELVRLLRAAGYAVQVVMSETATRFVGVPTFQALSGVGVRHSLWDAQAEAAMGHIELARWASAVIVAPATANTLAKMAHGLADDLLTTLLLATTAPVWVAPAMNHRMWLHPATQANMDLLEARGVTRIGPGSGAQACGDTGPGRMAEPADIASVVLAAMGVKK